MQWIAKDPPIYVHPDDTWYCERDRKVYKPDMQKLAWVCGDIVKPFPLKKWRLLKG